MKILNGLLQRHPEWVREFSTNFVATVLGIVLTFGVTEWLERREERATAEALVERSFTNLEDRIESLENVLETLRMQDSLLIICTEALPDKLDSVPDEVFIELISLMNVSWNLFGSKSVETGFKQDIHSQKIVGNFADVLSEAFEVINYAEGLNVNVNEFKLTFQRHSMSYWSYSGMNLTRERAIRLLSDPESVFCLTQISETYQSLKRAVSHSRNYLNQAHRLWDEEISYEEFLEFSNAHKTL